MLAPIALALPLLSSPQLSAEQPLAFEPVAPGVFRASVGDPEEFGLLHVAGGKSLDEALAKLGDAELPDDAAAASARVTPRSTSLRFPLAADEDVYGLGLDFDRVRQNGTIHHLHVDHWGGEAGRTHAPVPLWISSRGYGVLVDSARYLDVWVGTGLRAESDAPPPIRDRTTDRAWDPHPPGDSVEVLVPAAGARVYVFAGPTPLDAVRRYVLFTGGGVLPPTWGLGFVHRTPTGYGADDVRREVREFEEHGFPLSVIGLEPGWQSHAYPCSLTWDEGRFPEPAALLDELLEEHGVRANLWMNPYVLPGSPLAESLADHRGSHRVWNGEVIDFEVPEARELYVEHLTRETIERGASGFKLDEVDGFDRWLWPDVAAFPSGLDAEQIRQTYALRMTRMLDEAYRARDQRTWGLVRASNAGGSRLPFVLYNDHYSHRDFITALCNASFTGLLWTPEVRSSGSSEEWLRRMQTVCFSPLAMLNAWSSGTKPWTFEDVEDEVREATTFRTQLWPYLYTAFAMYRFEGTPPVRAMPLVEGWSQAGEPAQRRARLADQFVVGPDLLVAPLFAGEASRDVLLPAGRWYDYYTGAFVGDGEQIRVQPPDHRIPLFVRDGGVMFLDADGALSFEGDAPIALEVRWYGTRPARARLYQDDGLTFAHERGERVWYTWNIGPLTESGLEMSVETESTGPSRYGLRSIRSMTSAADDR